MREHVKSDNRSWASDILKRYDPDFKYIWERYHEELHKNIDATKIWVDLGCGKNPHVAEFGGMAAYSVGTDLFADAGISLPFVVSRLPLLPFQSESVDVVTLSFVVEHLKEVESNFQEIYRILKPRGILIVLTTNAASPYIVLARWTPFKFKNIIIRKLYRVQEDDVLPTFHRFNFPKEFHELGLKMPFVLQRLHYLQDVNFVRKGLFWFFFVGHLLTKNRYQRFRTNLLGVFQKMA